MARLELSLLGPLEVTLDGEPVTQFESNKVRALLVYLAVEADRPHRRDALVTLLWPDRSSRAARVNLRTALANLRKAIGDRTPSGDRDADPPFLLITHDAIQFNSASDCWVDVARFRALVEPHPPGDPSTEQLEEAMALYRGPFLEGFSLRDSAAFDDWCLLTREHLHRQALTAFQRLAGEVERDGDVQRACELVQRLVELEPWQEQARRELMRLLALTGQRNAALAQYEACRETLMEGLGVEPEEETTLLYKCIRDGRELPSPSRGPPHNLPLPLVPLIGREAELAEIHERLQDPACRLLTVMGPGGVGKSRLATQAAADLLREFPHGVYLVNLAPISSPELLASTIMEALNLPLHGSAHPRVQLLNALREKRLLLVLDNVEHLLEGTPLITQMLRAAPGVKLLVTSRERLNVRDEWLLPLQGLRFPEEEVIKAGENALMRAREGAAAEERAAALEGYSAIQLFLQCARRVQPGFSLAKADPWSVARICQLVEGMPLAIELASPWVRMMPRQEIALEIERNLEFLSSSLRDMPERHRSMRAVFERSWSLLTVEERDVLGKLSVFRGGFHREAAEAVAMRLSRSPASLTTLSSLVDSSWLRVTPSGRYEMHELTRQYAREKLGAEADEVRGQHSVYYTVFLQDREPQLRGRGQSDVLHEILADIDNVRAAWSWSVERGDVNGVSRCVESLWYSAEYWGWFHEIAEAFSRAVTRLKEQLAASRSGDASSARDHVAAVVAEILHREAFARLRLGMNARAKGLCEESLALLQCLGNDVRQEKARAHAKLTLGMALRHLGEVQRGDQLLREGLAHATAAGDIWGTTLGLRILGWYTLGTGRYLEAEEFLQQAIAIWGSLGEDIRRAHCLSDLSQVLIARGEIERAKNTAQEAFRVWQECGDQGGFPYALRAMGELAAACGNYELAKQYYQDALTIAIQIGNRRSETLCLRASGWVAYEQRDFLEARRLFQKAQVIARDADDLQSPAALVGLGYATYKLGDLQQARRHFGQALEEAMGMGLTPQALDALVGMANLSIHEGGRGRAAELLSLAVQHSATAHLVRDRARQLLSKLESEMTPGTLAAATARGKVQDLEEVAAAMLRDAEKAH